MKIIMTEGNIPDSHKRPAWYFLPDSALINSGKPFFIPEFADTIEAIPVWAVRISRLGKSILPRFAHRYYSEIAPAIHFRAPRLKEELEAEGLPYDMAYGFDRSLVMGEFLPSDGRDNSTLLLKRNSKEVAACRLGELPYSIDDIISAISSQNTLKMGDLIIPAIPEGVTLAIGDCLEIASGDSGFFKVFIK